MVIVVSACDAKCRQKTILALRLVRRYAQNVAVLGDVPPSRATSQDVGPARNTSWGGGGDIYGANKREWCRIYWTPFSFVINALTWNLLGPCVLVVRRTMKHVFAPNRLPYTAGSPSVQHDDVPSLRSVVRGPHDCCPAHICSRQVQ